MALPIPSSIRKLCIAILFLLLTLLVHRNLLSGPDHLLPTYLNTSEHPADGDALMFCWNFWWINGWVHGEHSLFFTHMLHHPVGTPLTHHTLSISNGILALPLSAQGKTVLAFNVLFMLHTFFTGYFTYKLLTELKIRPVWALLAGEIAMLWPPRISHISCHINVAGTAWFAFTLWMFVRLTKKNTPGRIVFAVMGLVMTGTSGHYLFVSLFLTLLIIAPYSFRTGNKTTFLYFLSALLIGCLLLLPVYFPLISNHSDIPHRELIEKDQYSLALSGFLNPPPGHLFHKLFGLNSSFHNAKTIEQTGYIGICLIFFILGAISIKKSSGKWILSAAILVLLSLGPFLSIGSFSLPMPYKLLEKIPGFAFGRTPGRFAVPVGILLGVATAFYLDRLHRLEQRRILVACCLYAIILVDYFPPPFPVINAQIPACYQSLEKKPGKQSGIMDVPNDLEIRWYQMYQTEHDIPITGGFVSRFPSREYYRRLNDLPLLKKLSNAETAEDALYNSDPVSTFDLIRLLKISEIVIHRNFLHLTHPLDTEEIGKIWHASPVIDDGQRIIMHIDTRNAASGDQIRCYFTHHWFESEHWNDIDTPVRWADGRKASIHLFAPSDAGHVSIFFKALSAPQIPSGQEISVFFRDTPIWSKNLSQPFIWYDCEFTLPEPLLPDGDSLTFFFANSTPPASIPNLNSADNRSLSVAFTDFRMRK
ncbi:hypothetical protein JW979_03780 [bacterium]|nr:hypothetical protein [candidate division CSSED10-310 bacterium]